MKGISAAVRENLQGFGPQTNDEAWDSKCKLHNSCDEDRIMCESSSHILQTAQGSERTLYITLMKEYVPNVNK